MRRVAELRHRKGKAYSADMAHYLRQLSEENTNAAELDQLRRNLLRCINEELTARQREFLYMYYVQRISQPQIARNLGLDASTVSKTMKRGEQRLLRCLRYGARKYLRTLEE